VALVLNPIPRIGIRQRDQLTIASRTSPHDAIDKFINDCGAQWGARRDMIERAGHVVTEVIDAIRDADLATEDMTLEPGFNEQQLDIRILYGGPPLVISRTRPTREEILDNEDGAQAGRLHGGRLASRATSRASGGIAELRITIDH
jgi:xanthine permease XanP